MDYEAHWQALYDELRTALDGGGHSDVDVVHVFTGESPLIRSYEPPLLVYKQETERTLGTVGDGNNKVISSNFMLTAYSENLGKALGIASVAVTHLTEDAGAFATSDGYETTNVRVIGNMSLYEQDSKLYAIHVRVEWERSA